MYSFVKETEGEKVSKLDRSTFILNPKLHDGTCSIIEIHNCFIRGKVQVLAKFEYDDDETTICSY